MTAGSDADIQRRPGRLNRESYNRIAASWDSARRALYAQEREYLDTFLRDLPVPSSILDLGCGTGRPIAEYVLARGHDVTGVDQAEKLLEIARRRLPQATWIESSIEDFDPTGHFAGIVCWDAMFHIERSRHEELIERMASRLEKHGRLMLTFGGSEHPAFTDSMFGEMFYYDSPPPHAMLGMLDRVGFAPLVSEFLNQPMPGRDKGRYAVVAQLR